MDGDKKFWITVLILALGLVGAYIFLVRPLQRQNAMKAQELVTRIKRLESLASKGAQLPNDKIVKKFQDYKDWLKAEEDRAREFFLSYDAQLEANITGVADPAPVDVKAAYREGMARWRRSLKARRIQLLEKAIPLFPWEESESLPKPEEYKQIFNRYWILNALLTQLSNRGHRAVAIEKIDFGQGSGLGPLGTPLGAGEPMGGMPKPTKSTKTKSKPDRKLYDLIPVEVTFLMRSAEVVPCLHDLMKRSKKNLPFLVESIEITKIRIVDMKQYAIRFLPPPVRVKLKLHVVDFRTDGQVKSPEKKSPSAGKKAGG